MYNISFKKEWWTMLCTLSDEEIAQVVRAVNAINQGEDLTSISPLGDMLLSKYIKQRYRSNIYRQNIKKRWSKDDEPTAQPPTEQTEPPTEQPAVQPTEQLTSQPTSQPVVQQTTQPTVQQAVQPKSYKEEALNDTAWCESIAMINHITIENISDRLSEFDLFLLSQCKAHPNVAEYKRHFAYWIKMQTTHTQQQSQPQEKLTTQFNKLLYRMGNIPEADVLRADWQRVEQAERDNKADYSNFKKYIVEGLSLNEIRKIHNLTLPTNKQEWETIEDFYKLCWTEN